MLMLLRCCHAELQPQPLFTDATLEVCFMPPPIILSDTMLDTPLMMLARFFAFATLY